MQQKWNGKWAIFRNMEGEVLIEGKMVLEDAKIMPEISRLVMRFEDEDLSED